MSKILAILGATGQQGGSVVQYVLNDPELSKEYKIRAITRDVNSTKSKQLAAQVQVVRADPEDAGSLRAALTGVHTVFSMTTRTLTEADPLNYEFETAKRIADIAVKSGVEYIIFSTLPSVSEISGGKFTKVANFDSKAKAEKYIRGLPVKSAFFSPGGFMENYNLWSKPQRARDGSEKWVMARFNHPSTVIPLIAAVEDTGKFVGAILAEPDRYAGKTFEAAQGFYSCDAVAAAIAKSTGKNVVYEQVSKEDFRKSLPFLEDVFMEAFQYGEEFGYWGPESEKSVAWAKENARGTLTSLEEWLKLHPIQLE